MSRKRAKPPRACDYTKAFIKDWQRLSRSGRYDMNCLKTVMLQLIDGQNPLPPELKDHPLTGNMTGLRECHIGGDLLLVYRLAEHKAGKMVVFIRVGIHAELFE